MHPQCELWPEIFLNCNPNISDAQLKYKNETKGSAGIHRNSILTVCILSTKNAEQHKEYILRQLGHLLNEDPQLSVSILRWVWIYRKAWLYQFTVFMKIQRIIMMSIILMLHHINGYAHRPGLAGNKRWNVRWEA
jgi:hypothetical protein